MRRTPALALLLLLGAPSSARADPPRPARAWAAEVRATYTLLGGEGRSTGGVMPVVSARRRFGPDGWGTYAGAELGAFGFGDDPHWLGVLTGPTLGAEAHELELPGRMGQVTLGAQITASLGRIPTCNAWGACARFWGLFPALGVSVRYAASEAFDAGLLVNARVVRTWAWSGVSVEPAIGGRFSW